MALITLDQNKKRDVVLIGRVTLDFNPNELNTTLDKAKTFSMYLGGSPANMAVGINKMGKKVGFIGCVSADHFGDFAVNYFCQRGIDVSQIIRARHGEKIGLTFTEMKSPQESSILMYREKVADLQITPANVDEQYIADSKILVVSGTALSFCPSREACLLAAQYAQKHGTKIVFDIDYRPYNWQSKEEIAVYYSLLTGMSDVVIGSREEFNLTENLPENTKTHPEDYELADKYIAGGCKIVVIKHGKTGSIAYTAEHKAYKVSSYHIKLLKSFGGGDAYGSAFIYGLLAGWDVADTLKYSTAHAAMVVASHSCSDAMQTLEQIKRFINNHSTEKVVHPMEWEEKL
jgi:5-dehydro-2-deoxygluconokinase